MTPEESKKLDEVYSLVKENHTIVKKIRAHQKNAQMIKVLYWLIIIGIGVGGFVYLKPFLDQISGMYTQGQDAFESIKDFNASASGVRSLLE